MPQEAGYQQQVGPAQPVALPSAGPAAFGAGVGEATQQLGGTIHEAKLRAYQIERQLKADQESTEVAARFAKARLDNDAALEALKTDPTKVGAGGQGYTAAVQAMLDQQRGALTDNIVENRTRAAAVRQFDDYAAQTVEAAQHYQLGTAIKKSVTDNAQATSTMRNRISTNPDSYNQEVQTRIAEIHNLTLLTPDQRDAALREAMGEADLGRVQGMVNGGAAPAALTMIRGGAFDSYLSPEQKEWADRLAETAIRRDEAAARADAAHALAQQKEQLATQRAALDAGAGTPQDWANLAHGYTAIGDTSSAVTARAKGGEQMATLQHRGDTLPQMDQQIGALVAKQAKRGGLSVAEASTLSGLQALRGQTAGRLGQAGGALAQYEFATGRTLPPLNLSDPASVAQRVSFAKAAAQQYGRAIIEPLKQGEIEGLRDMASGTPSERLQAIDQIRGFGDARTIAGAAGQIAGRDDGQFRVAALMPRDVSRDILRGDDTLKSAPQVWKEANATADFAKWYGNALSQMGGSYRDDVFKAARAFYAQRASDGGEHAYNPGRFAEAIETVIGRHPDGRGGTVNLPGKGLVLAPSDMRPAEVLQRFARATPQDYLAAAGGRHPRYSDGTTMTEAQFKQLLPTAVADGIYGFRGPSGHLVQDEQHNAYVVDLRKLPAR